MEKCASTAFFGLKIFHARTKEVDEWDVNDVVQEIFVRLIKNDYHLLKTYNPAKASLATWLTIVSRSTTIDFLRRRKLDSVSLEDEDIPVPNDHSNSSIDIPSDLLSPRQQLTLTLLFILSSMQGNNADNNKTTAQRKIENPSQLAAIGNTEDINK